MYMQILENNKCSKCGAMNYTESVNREMKTFIRCRGCGHEKLTSILTVSNSSNDNIIYNVAPFDEIKEF